MLNKDFSKSIEALESRSVFVDSPPRVIYVESVNGCSYGCVMCSSRDKNPKRVSHDLLDKLEPSFGDLEVLGIHDSGEPLLGDIPYFVEKSRKNDFVIHMNSTGFNLSNKLSDLLLTSRLSIRFSINAGKPETYWRIMGGHDLGQVVENIKYLTNKAADDGLRHDFWFSFIVMKENIGEIADFLRLAHYCGIKSVRFMSLRPNKRILLGCKVPQRNFRFSYFDQFNGGVRRKFLSELPAYKKLAGDLGITIEAGSMEYDAANVGLVRDVLGRANRRFFGNLLPIFPRRFGGFCVVPWIGQLIVCQDGSVNMCCSTTNYLGNLNDSSIGDLWNGDGMRKVRESFKRGEHPRVCGYCRGIGFDEYPKNSRIHGFGLKD